MDHTRLVTSFIQGQSTPSVSTSSTDAWLSPGRLHTYLQLAGSDHDRALTLYSWNCDLAGACARDLGHLEVAIRNSYNQALIQNYPDWIWSYRPSPQGPVNSPIFDNSHHQVTNNKLSDLHRLNKGALSSLFNARKKAGVDHANLGHSNIPEGKILANLTFGFWSFLTEPLRANILWNQALGNIPGIPSRAWIHTRMLELAKLRNRVAHMEPLIGTSSALPQNLVRIDEVLSVMVKPDVLNWIASTSRVPALYRQGVAAGVLNPPISTYLGYQLS